LAEVRKLLDHGIDPGEIDVLNRKADRAAQTVEDLADAYLEKWARPRKRSAAEDERILRNDVIPAWGRRKAKDIIRRDVIALLDRILDRGSPIAANRTLAVIRRMFGWALSRDIISVNPCAAVKAPGAEKRRDRVLSADEIATFWRALEDPALPISRPIRLALRLQLVTAQRKGEVISADWSEFDLAEGIWTIPANKAKNAMAHRVPISTLARGVLDEIPEPRSGLIFPSPRGEGPIAGLSVEHEMRKHRIALGVGNAPPITFAALRRATWPAWE
jgi:integrase